MSTKPKFKAQPPSQGEVHLLLPADQRNALDAIRASFQQQVAQPVLRAPSWPVARRELQRLFPVARQLFPLFGAPFFGYDPEALSRGGHSSFVRALQGPNSGDALASATIQNAISVRHLLSKAGMNYIQTLRGLKTSPPPEGLALVSASLLDAAIPEAILGLALGETPQASSREVVHQLSELALNQAARGLVAVETWSAGLSGTPFFGQIKQALAASLQEAPRGVEAAFLSQDGTCFRLTGSSWTPELSRFGAETTLKLQRSLAPSGRPYLEGGFASPFHPPPGWCPLSREDA